MSTTTANQFIGSKISLISKSEIRYEGILYSLDLQDATISLAKVKSFGTEDRPTERPVPPKEEVYEFIIFRGADIKGIDVLEPPKPAPTLTSGLPNDPAIVEVSHYHSAAGQSSQGGVSRSNGSTPTLFSNRKSPIIDLVTQVQDDNTGKNISQYNNRQEDGRRSRQEDGRRSRQDDGRRSRQSSEDRRRQQQNRQQQQQGQGGQAERQSGGYQPRGRGQYVNYRGGFRGGRGGTRGGYRPQGIIQAQMPPKVTFNDPYDFDKANEELQNVFSKLKVTKSADEKKKEGGEPEEGSLANNVEQEEQENKEPAEPFYVKDSFFDKISCESTERSKGKGTRIDWRAERKLNAETFGVPVNNGQRRGGGGYRGFRGGYQGYRGNSGGGYQQRGGYGGYNNYSSGGYYQYNNRYNGGRGQRGGYRQQQQQQPSSQQQQQQQAAAQ